MMSGIWKKVLWKQKSKTYYAIALVFLAIGFSIATLSLQLFELAQSTIAQSNSDKFLIVGKKVSLMASLLGSPSGFDGEDIKGLQGLKAVDEIGVFRSNGFQIKAQAMSMKLDLFFESVPDKWVDNPPSDFKWKKGDDFIPMLISKEILNMWNFGFAQSQGKPQLDLATIKAIPLKVLVGTKVYQARVVGLTSRYTTVLVPDSFLEFANENFATKKPVTSRLVLKCNDPSSEELANYFEKKSIDFSTDSVLKEKANTILSSLLSISGAIGIAFLLLAVIILILIMSLLLESSKSNIQLLKQLGYSNSKLTQKYTKKIHLQMGFSIGLGILTGYLGYLLLYWKLQHFIGEKESIIGFISIAITILLGIITHLIIHQKIKKSLATL